MSIFDYRPDIVYTLKDINSIDNITRKYADRAETYLNSGTPNIIGKVLGVKESLKEATAVTDNRLKDVVAKTDIVFDDVFRQKVSLLPDSSLLINDGTITYQLYKIAKDDPYMVPIRDAWDEYHAGIDGEVEAELLPYMDELNDLINYILYFIEKAILPNESQETLSDISKLKESELNQIERYFSLQDELEKAINTSNPNIVSINKQYDISELQLNYKKNLNIALLTSMSKLSDTVQDICDVSIAQFHQLQRDGIDNEMRAYRKKVNLGDIDLRTMIYVVFADQYRNTINAKREHDASGNMLIVEEIFRNAIVESRLYRDVAIKSLTEMLHADSNAVIGPVEKAFIDSIDKMTSSYGRSALATKNAIESTVSSIGSLVDQIYEKYRTRTMYKSLSK